MDIGFIGVGRMGFHMARRLIEAGHKVVAYDSSQEALGNIARLGARAMRSPVEVADEVETVLASLPTPDIVLAVATGANGVARGKKVRRFVDLSTTGSRMAAHVAELLARHDIVQIDAPVSGGVGGAEKGTLAVMVSGPAVDVAKVETALQVIGRVFVIGDRPGAGQTMKLINNFLSATAMAATAEAMAMGVKAGLDPVQMLDVINAGSGRNTASQDKFPRAIVTGKFDYGFATGLMVKDVRLCLSEADALGVSTDVMRAVGALWQATLDEFGPDKDFTYVAQTVEQRAGIKVRAK